MDASGGQTMNNPTVDDMSKLTHLDEEAVLRNLRERYYSDQIYTYSGLFCVVVNPYKQLPIYSNDVLHRYHRKAREECPPHVFAIADAAYRAMMTSHKDQSILCTGESGAGKTENTKRVIHYLAHVAGVARVDTYNSPSKSQLSVISELEQKLLGANPILEAFGNSMTVKNDNSSRFGKYIRVNFDKGGFICGARIETYLLEKSRTCRQAESERGFHIFYQLLRGASPEKKARLLLKGVNDYTFLNHGSLSIQGVDDAHEFRETREALDVMGLSHTEIEAVMQTLSAILLLGNLGFRPESASSDQASIVDEAVAQQVCHLLGLQVGEFTKAVLRPRFNLHAEVVERSQDAAQAKFSIEAVSKAAYERLFKWLVGRLNKAMDRASISGTANFIGILDISGFEINKKNGLEQLCINYTNENLQQFFNHTMFIHEQEEYRREGIDWEFIDFGLDLQPTIDLIDKPMGVLALLDEQCLFPKGTDKSLVEKLVKHQAEHPKLIVPDHRSKSDFAIAHYAGRVDYYVDEWLTKNRDPLNDNIVELLQNSSESLVRTTWKGAEFTGLSLLEGTTLSLRVKRGFFRTCAQLNKEQLLRLMTDLRATSPHFVRCIIPNYAKQPGQLDEALVLEQLKCNGVLEGIRISRKGFPSRIPFGEFKQRYKMIAQVPKQSQDSKEDARRMLVKLDVAEDDYRIGLSKVFCRTGIIAGLETRLDREMERRIKLLQQAARKFLDIRRREKEVRLQEASRVIQRNFAVFAEMQKDPWCRLFFQVRPLVRVSNSDSEMRGLREEKAHDKDYIAKLEADGLAKQERINQLETEELAYQQKLQSEAQEKSELDERLTTLKSSNEKLLGLVEELHSKQEESDSHLHQLSTEKAKLETSLAEALSAVQKSERTRVKLQAEHDKLSLTIKERDKRIDEATALVEKSSNEKKALQEQVALLSEKLQEEERARSKAQKNDEKLESKVAELQEGLEKEKAARREAEAAKRQLQRDLEEKTEQLAEKSALAEKATEGMLKLEATFKCAQDKLEEETQRAADLERGKRNLETRLFDTKEELKGEEEKRQRVERMCKELQNELESVRTNESLLLDSSMVSMHRKENTIQQQERFERMERDHEEEIEQLKAKQQKLLAETERKHAEEAEENRECFEQMKKKLQQQVESLSEQITSLNLEKVTYSRMKHDLEHRLSEAQRQLEVELITAVKYKDSYDAENGKSKRLRRQLNEKEDEVENERSEIRKLQRQVTKLEEAIKDLNLENEVLRLRSNSGNIYEGANSNLTPGGSRGTGTGRQTTATVDLSGTNVDVETPSEGFFRAC